MATPRSAIGLIARGPYKRSSAEQHHSGYDAHYAKCGILAFLRQSAGAHPGFHIFRLLHFSLFLCEI
jgi:hypothetical protein